jgi:hypothetical protein
VCLLGAYLPLRTERAELLHRTLLETLPGFAWGSPLGFLAGAFDIFVVAWVFGAYYVWMHNTSLIHSRDASEQRSCQAFCLDVRTDVSRPSLCEYNGLKTRIKMT